MKVWDIVAPYFLPNIDPTWSYHLRLRGAWTAALWAIVEIIALCSISLLRIPQLAPSPRQLLQMAALICGYNLACWLVADPAAFFLNLNIVGPPALGAQWYLSWWPLMKRWMWHEPPHLGGLHQIRLLPYR